VAAVTGSLLVRRLLLGQRGGHVWMFCEKFPDFYDLLFSHETTVNV
jgi:hypothetical protein